MNIQSVKHYHVAYDETILGETKTCVLNKFHYSKMECDRYIQWLKASHQKICNPRAVFVEVSYKVIEPDHMRQGLEKLYNQTLPNLDDATEVETK